MLFDCFSNLKTVLPFFFGGAIKHPLSKFPVRKKNFLVKNGSHFEFSNFSQKLQNIKLLISR